MWDTLLSNSLVANPPRAQMPVNFPISEKLQVGFLRTTSVLTTTLKTRAALEGYSSSGSVLAGAGMEEVATEHDETGSKFNQVVFIKDISWLASTRSFGARAANTHRYRSGSGGVRSDWPCRKCDQGLE